MCCLYPAHLALSGSFGCRCISCGTSPQCARLDLVFTYCSLLSLDKNASEWKVKLPSLPCVFLIYP